MSSSRKKGPQVEGAHEGPPYPPSWAPMRRQFEPLGAHWATRIEGIKQTFAGSPNTTAHWQTPLHGQGAPTPWPNEITLRGIDVRCILEKLEDERYTFSSVTESTVDAYLDRICAYKNELQLQRPFEVSIDSPNDTIIVDHPLDEKPKPGEGLSCRYMTFKKWREVTGPDDVDLNDDKEFGLDDSKTEPSLAYMELEKMDCIKSNFQNLDVRTTLFPPKPSGGRDVPVIQCERQ
jgi:hypothetical protein